MNNEPTLCLCVRPRKRPFKDRQHYAFVLTSEEIKEFKEKRDLEQTMVIQEIAEIEEIKARKIQEEKDIEEN